MRIEILKSIEGYTIEVNGCVFFYNTSKEVIKSVDKLLNSTTIQEIPEETYVGYKKPVNPAKMVVELLDQLNFGELQCLVQIAQEKSVKACHKEILNMTGENRK